MQFRARLGVPATIVAHHGYGPAHYDVLIASGGRCPTLRWAPARPGSLRQWHWRWQAPHRRRYLSAAGPVSGGRGRLQRVWSGPVDWVADGAGGWRLRTADWTAHGRQDGALAIDAEALLPAIRAAQSQI